MFVTFLKPRSNKQEEIPSSCHLEDDSPFGMSVSKVDQWYLKEYMSFTSAIIIVFSGTLGAKH